MNRPRALFLQYTNPGGYPPLQHIAEILLERGWALTFLGIRGGTAAALTLEPHHNQRVVLMKDARRGWRQKLHYAMFCVRALLMQSVLRAECVYVSDPLAAPVGVLVARLFPRCKVIYHEHDAPAPVTTRFMRWVQARRASLGRCADAVVIPNAARARNFRVEAQTARDPHVVWNCPMRHEASKAREDFSAGPIRLLYHGSIVPERLPLALLDAIALLPGDVRLRVIGYETAGSRGYLRRLALRAGELGLADRLELVGALPRSEMLEHARASHVGLALMPGASDDPNVRDMLGASNKPFDYMACGCAVLVSARPDWEEMFVRNGFAASCDPDSAESMRGALAKLCTDRQSLRQIGERGRRRVESEWNYETAFEPVLRLIEPGRRRSVEVAA